MESFGSYNTQATVGVTEDKDGVRPRGDEEFITAVDYVSACGSEVVTDGVHIDLGSIQLEVLEEYPVEVVVVVLAGVGKNHVEVPAAFVYHGRQADDLGPCAHYYDELESSVFLEPYV